MRLGVGVVLGFLLLGFCFDLLLLTFGLFGIWRFWLLALGRLFGYGRLKEGKRITKGK
jgi:hypothetical protein